MTRRDEFGFTLIEVLTATIIAVLAVVGLAYTFGMGRAFINRFEMARAALGVAQERLEILHSAPASSFAFAAAPGDLSTHVWPDSVTHVVPFYRSGTQVGVEEWTVSWYDDPATTLAHDLKRVTVRVRWSQGSLTDMISLTRLFPPT